MQRVLMTTSDNMTSYNVSMTSAPPLPPATMSDDGASFFDNQTCPPLRSVPLNTLAGLIGVCVITGNGLVILAILGGRSRLFRPMYWFIVHISLSDFLLGIMCVWNYCLMSILNINNTLNSLIVIHSFWLVSACASVLGILLLALDRYMQVVHRDFHRIYFNQITVGVCILLCWVIPICLYMVPPMIFSATCKCRCEEDRFMECFPTEKCSLLIPPFEKALVKSAAIFLFVVMPCPIVIYCMIFHKVRKQTQLFHQRMRKRDVRLIKTLVAIMAIFVITLLPTGVLMAIDGLAIINDPNLINFGLGTFMLATLNSLANPILYIWRISAIRTSLQRQLPFLKTPSNLNRTSLNNQSGKFDPRRTCCGGSRPNNSQSCEVRVPTANEEGASVNGGGNGKGVNRRKASWLVLFTRVGFNGMSSQESTPDISRTRKFQGGVGVGGLDSSDHVTCTSGDEIVIPPGVGDQQRPLTAKRGLKWKKEKLKKGKVAKQQQRRPQESQETSFHPNRNISKSTPTTTTTITTNP